MMTTRCEKNKKVTGGIPGAYDYELNHVSRSPYTAGAPNRYRLAATGVLHFAKETRISLCKRPLPSDKLLRFPQGCTVSEFPEFGRIHG